MLDDHPGNFPVKKGREYFLQIPICIVSFMTRIKATCHTLNDHIDNGRVSKNGILLEMIKVCKVRDM